MSKKELVEIKRNQTGHGLLIEHDGYISMDNAKIQQIKESISNHDGDWYCPNPFIVDAVFQKYDIENANGRIYPEAVLKREVEKYQVRIRERRALGECYTPDAMVLTENGWKSIESIGEGENILTLNTDTNEIEIKPVLRKIEYDYEGDMVHIKNLHVDELVTPNHKYPIYTRYHKYRGAYTAEEILNQTIPDFSHNYIPKMGDWVGENDEFFIIPNLPKERVERMCSNIQEKYSSDLVIPMDIFAKFMGIYLSEGYCDKGEDGNRVFIAQKKESVCRDIENLLSEWGIKYTINQKEDNAKIYVIIDMRLCAYLKQFGLCYDKFVPLELKKQNKKILKLFYDWFVKGDGRSFINESRGETEPSTDDVFSTSKQLIMDLNEIQLKIGYSGTYHMEKRDNDRYIGDRLIEGKNCKPMHFSYRSKVKGVYLDKRHMKCEKVSYNGKVMCLEVENHTFYVMVNGKTHWSHNCNHPSDSVIDLGRISHNIIELHWEGRTLVGKIELNLSQGYVRHGICSTLGDTVANLLLNGYKIGVSSRGVGSVENKYGKMIVGDDFEIICWDVVCDPSTPNAYIGKKEELQQYVETKEHMGDVITEKINKIKKILD